MSSWGSKLLEQPYSFSCVKEVGGTYSNGAIQVKKSPGHIQNIHIGVITQLERYLSFPFYLSDGVQLYSETPE